jgi:FMN phosphatase YigB (HAD superfamily)
MNIRAVIFDIYNTLLEVGPGPADAERRWAITWRKTGLGEPPFSLAEFNRRSEQRISGINASAKSRGIAYPEVNWPSVAKTVLPELCRFAEEALDDWLHHHAQLQRSASLAPGGGLLLARLREAKLHLGICSNCQPYTLRELKEALATARLSLGIFEPGLCFYSYRAGFSKPDAAAFAGLGQQLNRMGISSGETLMVGDRLDNDILPAQALGWQTWHVGQGNTASSGGWAELMLKLFP